MGVAIEIPFRTARMFDDRTREALKRLAAPDSTEAHAPSGLVMELSAWEHFGPHHRQVVIDPSTQIYGFGWVPDVNMHATFRMRPIKPRFREIAGGAYLCLLDDLEFNEFINGIPKRFPGVAPPGADLSQLELEIMIFPGAVALTWGQALPRWDKGLETVRRALTENLLVFVDQDESAHGRLSGVTRVKRALEASLSRSAAEEEGAECEPLAELHLVALDR